MNKRLFIGGLPWSVTDAQLKDLFLKAGDVVSAQVIVDRDTNRSKGFGFVEMSTEEGAQKAIELLNETEVEGRKIIVNTARPLEERPSRNFHKNSYSDRNRFGGRNNNDKRRGGRNRY